ncbi:hypothetical protein VNO80_03193 [Phaseolus coccineus]|uniref:Uncharacterized protein n=1 Tax=Phaseolus coccineus TaxID=3886 RepID=A0AAN9NR88_PHACN
MPRAPAMPACLAPRRCPHASRPGDARMPRAPAMPACLAPRRCPHASRPGDARMPRAPAMPACLAPRRCPHASRPGDARMPRAPAMPACLAPRRCPHASRPGDARMPLTLAMTDDGLITLVPRVVDLDGDQEIPVIVAGGIVDSQGYVADLALGSQGVYLGTRWTSAQVDIGVG